jgi:ribosomal protein S18 acetylase RimI-like enzyme
MRLVYWFAAGDCQPDEDVLRRWSGSLVDRKATFRLSLADRAHAATGLGDQTVRISGQSRDNVSPELVALAISAGEFSRFRRDPRIPPAAFRGLYETWIRRSVAGELADCVFVASRNGGEPSGLVTVRVRDGIGEIGLVSVAEFARGQGIGGLLMNRAMDWIEASGASVAMVVTQLDNTAACRLYERLQFELTDVAHVYHFWPSGASEP